MKKDSRLVIIFLTIIIGLFLGIFINYGLEKIGLIKINNYNYSEYHKKEENNILDKINNVVGKLEFTIDNKITTYFPFYHEVNTIYQTFNFNTNKLVYDDIPIKVDSNGEYVFYNKENGFFYLTENYPESELNKRVDKQIELFNLLSNKGIDVNIYVPTSYQFTKLKSNNLFPYVEKFVNGLNDDIDVSVMEINDIEQYKKYFYKTDHHWTIDGVLAAYEDICNMLNIEPIKNLEIEEHTDRKFYGSIAKASLNDDVYDYIRDITYKPQYDVYVNGAIPSDTFKPRNIRLDRDYKYYDYYVQYFNGQYGNVVYDYHDNSKDNLLIIGDSFTWQCDYLIASSFNKTHVINLRYDEYINNDFDIEKYIVENDISQVLFLYESSSIIFNKHDFNLEGMLN